MFVWRGLKKAFDKLHVGAPRCEFGSGIWASLVLEAKSPSREAFGQSFIRVAATLDVAWIL